MEYFNAVKINSFGTSEVLEQTTHKLNEPNSDEVIIKISHCGIAFLDILMRKGSYPNLPSLPFILGKDVVGHIHKVGKDVKDLKVGQRVLSHLNLGGYAQFAITDAKNIIKVSENLDANKLVALPLNYVTAYQLLHRIAKVKKGSTILVHGGAGGVGTALLELARLSGVKTYATVSSKEKIESVKKRGAIPINYKSTDFVSFFKEEAPKGIDAVFDPIAEDYWKKSSKVLKKGGILVAYGFSSLVSNDNVISPEELSNVIGKLVELEKSEIKTIWYSITKLKMEEPEIYFEDLLKVVKLFEEGIIDPEVDSIFSLKDVKKAHDFIEKGSVIGKVVLKI